MLDGIRCTGIFPFCIVSHPGRCDMWATELQQKQTNMACAGGLGLRDMLLYIVKVSFVYRHRYCRLLRTSCFMVSTIGRFMLRMVTFS